MGKGQGCVANRNVSTYKSKTVNKKKRKRNQVSRKKKEREELLEYGANVFLIV